MEATARRATPQRGASRRSGRPTNPNAGDHSASVGSNGSMAYVTWWYLRWLGLVCMVAFASLYVQLPGLYGCDGLLPGE